MEIAAFFTAATAAAEAVVAITRNWVFYFCMVSFILVFAFKNGQVFTCDKQNHINTKYMI